MRYFMFSEEAGFNIFDTKEQAKKMLNDFLEGIEGDEIPVACRGVIDHSEKGAHTGKITHSVLGMTVATVPEGHKAVVTHLKPRKLEAVK